MSKAETQPLVLLTTEGKYKVKVSSVLNRSSDFQAKHMFTDSDSCWNSDGGNGDADGSSSIDGQWILLEFLGSGAETVTVKAINIMFQGGFVGSDGVVEMGASKDSLVQVCVLDHIHSIEDSNELQKWDIPALAPTLETCKFLRIRFPASTDFYGRVTIYRMEVHGHRA